MRILDLMIWAAAIVGNKSRAKALAVAPIGAALRPDTNWARAATPNKARAGKATNMIVAEAKLAMDPVMASARVR